MYLTLNKLSYLILSYLILCVLLQPANNLKPQSMGYDLLIGQSHDFCKAYSLFVAREASFASRFYEAHK